MNEPTMDKDDCQTLGEKTPTGSTFGFTLFGTNGEKVTVDSPEKLVAMIKEAPEMTFDVIVMLASKCYDQEELIAAQAEYIQMQAADKEPAHDEDGAPRPTYTRMN